METFVMMIALVAFAIGVLSAVLFLSQVLDRERLRDLGRRIGHWQFTIWRMMTAVIVAALLFHMFTARDGLFSFVLLCLGFLTWFVRNWQKEFVFLMGLGDGDFPGRHDKVIWAIMLSVFAPVGVWFFRAYHRAHWPEPVPAPAIDPERRTEESGGTATQPA
jgi:hypothetical protein